LQTPHAVGGNWQPELGVGYGGVPTGEGNVVEGVSGIDTQIEIEAVV
jgi:hypothetical protein